MINSGQNATPEAIASLAKILQGYQQNDTNNWFFNAIKNSQPNGLPTGTQRYDPTGNDALYKMNMVGSSVLGYPQTGIFNAPNPQNKIKGLLDEY
jgi:hypothetical protein